ncbi:MAG: helix-turn-helix transcriptional regulator [Pseudomonadota bacterium]
MPQTTALLDALKIALKAHGKTYREVAEHLELSTASVKRMFSEQNMSLARLDAICALMEIEITDLVAELGRDKRSLQQLDETQEQEIASDLSLLLVTVSVLNGMAIEDIVGYFNINEHECIRKLAYLDRQGIIELLPKNRIKLKVARNFAWLPDGPIQRLFQQKIAADYFSSRFTENDEKLIVLNGLLSEASIKIVQKKFERLAEEFEELNSEDASKPVAQRVGFTVVLAMRRWVFGLFQPYLRE